MSRQLLTYVNKSAESLASELIQVKHSCPVLLVRVQQQGLDTRVSAFSKDQNFSFVVLDHEGHHFPDRVEFNNSEDLEPQHCFAFVVEQVDSIRLSLLKGVKKTLSRCLKHYQFILAGPTHNFLAVDQHRGNIGADGETLKKHVSCFAVGCVYSLEDFIGLFATHEDASHRHRPQNQLVLC